MNLSQETIYKAVGADQYCPVVCRKSFVIDTSSWSIQLINTCLYGSYIMENSNPQHPMDSDLRSHLAEQFIATKDLSVKTWKYSWLICIIISTRRQSHLGLAPNSKCEISKVAVINFLHRCQLTLMSFYSNLFKRDKIKKKKRYSIGMFWERTIFAKAKEVSNYKRCCFV